MIIKGYDDSILALIILNKKIGLKNMENMAVKEHKCVLKIIWIIPSAPEFE